MSFYAIAGIIAGIVQACSIIPYIQEMIHGEVRPNVVSWILWTLIQLIIIAAQFAAGASWSVVIPIVMTFGTCLVLILCLFGYGYTRYGLVDGICLILAICAIIIWQLINDPVLAILISIVADLTAGIPTYVKAYREPFTESLLAWSLLIIANTLALIAAHPFNTANVAFPLYVSVVDVIFISLLVMRRRTLRRA
ncbi:MAG TPA: hypothetical protein VMU13_02415 [Candidatus Paceibacterota bacterium]|nr:hypothetical protein [Candidatus Paceibacterota bacterium]